MKTMTCRQLGGACDYEFHGDTFEDMARQSQEHGRKMMDQGEPAHMEAMKAMGILMQDPEQMKQWMEDKKRMFSELPG